MADKVQLIKEEIERRMNNLWYLIPEGEKVLKDDFTKDDANNLGKYTALENLLHFIDSLPKEPESEDLDREIGYYTTSKLLKKRNHSTGVYHLTQKECDNIARHFAEWQKKKSMQDFLEKIEKFISEKVQDYFLVDEEEYIVEFDKEECIKDFKNYMQDENEEQ